MHQLARGLDHKWAVHEKKRLLRNQREIPFSRRNARVRKIELGQQFRRITAIDIRVDRSPRRELLAADGYRFPPSRRIELSRDRKERIVHFFKIEPAKIVPPMKRIIRIEVGITGIRRTAH